MEELNARLEKIAEKNEARQRAAALRAGLVASAIYNVNRKKGTRRFRPTDFVRTPAKDLSPDEVREHLLSWARAVNKQHEA